MAADCDINLKIAMKVEKYPCLYNFKLTEYFRKDVTAKAKLKFKKNYQVCVGIYLFKILIVIFSKSV